MPSRLNNLKDQIQNKNNDSNEVTTIYHLIKELGCLPDILGREYEVVYEGNKIVKIIQKPIPITTLQILIDELDKDHKKQNKDMKKRGRRR
ncbi:MAG: hypothetical protein CMH64_01800 [Nanoarchaeota archaeon]|nr:hypothetical protein [Nanoarchaeota archaeon]|tara:strand:+ start:1625 stop:1897 length:273 start_codon:yes stop_codon:yes gene_type:complete